MRRIGQPLLMQIICLLLKLSYQKGSRLFDSNQQNALVFV